MLISQLLYQFIYSWMCFPAMRSICRLLSQDQNTSIDFHTPKQMGRSSTSISREESRSSASANRRGVLEGSFSNCCLVPSCVVYTNSCTRIGGMYGRRVDALHVAAWFGLDCIISTLINDERVDINPKRCLHPNASHVRLSSRHTSAVKLLLAHSTWREHNKWPWSFCFDGSIGASNEDVVDLLINWKKDILYFMNEPEKLKSNSTNLGG